MNILDMTLLLLVHSNQILGRHRRDSSSSEEGSIENLLYYQESKQRTTLPPTTVSTPAFLKYQEEQPACPCPKMCCSMCCECNDRPPSSFMLRQMQPQMQQQMQPQMQQQMPPHPVMQQQPNMHQRPRPQPPGPIIQSPVQHKPRTNKKKTPPLLLPIGSRRDMGSTYKDHIRGLLSHDEDIKKILQDLVKVTIKKVNLLEEIGSEGVQYNGNEDGDQEVREFEL